MYYQSIITINSTHCMYCRFGASEFYLATLWKGQFYSSSKSRHFWSAASFLKCFLYACTSNFSRMDAFRSTSSSFSSCGFSTRSRPRMCISCLTSILTSSGEQTASVSNGEGWRNQSSHSIHSPPHNIFQSLTNASLGKIKTFPYVLYRVNSKVIAAL